MTVVRWSVRGQVKLPPDGRMESEDWRLPRAAATRDDARGQGGCDGVSNVLPSLVHNALINEELLDPTTRELVIFAARPVDE